MKTTTSLSMPAIHAVQPKPTKTEIVNAMVVRAKVAHDAENERRKAAREKLRPKITALAIKALKGKKPAVNVYAYLNNAADSHVDVRFNHIQSPELDGLFQQYAELDRLHWDEKEVRRTINEQLTGISRPSPTRLLEDPKTVSAMDAMLKQWGI